MQSQRILAILAVLQLLELSILCAGERSKVSTEERVIQLLNLTSSYCKGAAPPPDNGSANIVDLDIFVNRIISVDIVKQQVSLDLWIVMVWTDSRLAWNETKDPSLAKFEQIFVPMDWLWIPVLSVDNPVEIKNVETREFLANVNSSGFVVLERPCAVTIKCPMLMQDFPFDTQICKTSFASSVKKQTRLQLENKRQRNQDYEFINNQNNEYCTKSVAIKIVDYSSDLPEYKKAQLTIQFERRPLYYITVLIIPSALILATCIFGFLLPADSGDRLALNVAILLSMSVFLQLAGSITPAQSESVPVLTWYFTVAMAVTTLSTIGSIIVHLCYRRAASREAVSSRALRLLFLNRLCGWKNTVEDVTSSSKDSTSTDLNRESHSCEAPGSEWRHIGSVVDRLLIICSVSFTLAIVLLVVGIAAKSGFGKCADLQPT